MIMSLLKIPFLASIVWGIRTVGTPPTKAAGPDEPRKPDLVEVVFLSFISLIKASFLAPPILELAAIIATNTSTYWLSQRVLSLLLPSGYPSVADYLRLTPLFLLGWAVCITGALLRLHCYRVLAEQFTFELGINKDHRLVTSGVYAYVRHPSYTGALVAGTGALISYGSPGALLTEAARSSNSIWPTIALAFEGLLMVMLFKMLQKRMQKEDVMLRDEFQDEWDMWATQVPYKLIPGVY